MRNLKLLISFMLLSLFFSCKKEISESENIKSVKSIVIKHEVDKIKFQDEVFPLIQELYEKDSVKYSMLNHIAKKASKEKNVEIFKLNVANLKEELKFY